ncbi:MAG TPA: hypothetical protein VIM70_06215 [Clostridium sp.]|uniref:hypothetical protein n=1 Tax=Clostridium sp. TaxID=1506 RepID=UPI002F9239A8
MERGLIRKDLANCMLEKEEIGLLTEDNYIKIDDVLTIIDRIEVKVNVLREELMLYRNLSEINTIYEMAFDLGNELY